MPKSKFFTWPYTHHWYKFFWNRPIDIWGIFNGFDEFLLRQVYVKFSALFRVSRLPPPYQDLAPLLSQVVSSFGANRVMWGRWLVFLSFYRKRKKGKKMKWWHVTEKKRAAYVLNILLQWLPICCSWMRI